MANWHVLVPSVIIAISVIFVIYWSEETALHYNVIVTHDDLKEAQVNPQNLPTAHYMGQRQIGGFSFIGLVNTQDVAVLATVEEVEIKLVDDSRNVTRYVYKEGTKELYRDLVLDVFEKEMTHDQMLDILMQQRTGETYAVSLESKIPMRFITLKVDQYLADATGQFADTIIAKTFGYGKGIRDNEPVYYENYKDMHYPIGEQSIYVLTDLHYSDFLVFDGFVGKYTINDKYQIQSKHNQHILDGFTHAQVEQIITGELTSIENKSTDHYMITWSLPIPLDEAIVIGTQIGDGTFIWPHISTREG